MEKELIINKENAIDTLHRMSAHLGSKLQAAELFSSCDDDKLRIEPMWVAAVTELSGLLMPYSSLTLYASSRCICPIIGKRSSSIILLSIARFISVTHYLPIGSHILTPRMQSFIKTSIARVLCR